MKQGGIAVSVLAEESQILVLVPRIWDLTVTTNRKLYIKERLALFNGKMVKSCYYYPSYTNRFSSEK